MFEVVLRHLDIVEQDESLFVLKRSPDVGFRGFARLLAVVEGVEYELQHVGGGLVPRRQIHNAVLEGRGSRMMRQLPEEGCLADPGLAGQFNGQSAIEARKRRRQLHLSSEQAAHRFGVEKNGGRPGMDVRALGSRGFADRRAERIPDCGGRSG